MSETAEQQVEARRLERSAREQQERRRIAIGSVVRLKSGGPAMVVAELSRGDGDAKIATLVWTDDSGKEHTITLDTRCVE